MATLNEIAYNIKNIVEGGVGSDDSNLSLRQVKQMIHVKRAEMLVKYTDNGRKTSEACYQVDVATVSSGGYQYKPFVGFNNNRGIRSIVYKDSTAIDASMELLALTQDHDRMFLQESRFVKSSSKKHATISGNKLFVFEGDSPTSGGVIEIKGVFSNPTTVSTYVDDDTTEYPIPSELISILTQELITKEIVLLYNLSADTPNNQADEKTKSKEV